MKKAIFFDVDGTIFDHGTMSIFDSTKEVLKELYESGEYDLFLSTGRSAKTLEEVKEILPYFKGLNLANGGEIIIDNEYAFIDYIDEKVLYNLIQEFDKNKISYGVITKDINYRCFYDDKIRKIFEKINRAECLIVEPGTFNEYDKGIEVWAFCETYKVKELRNNHPELTFFDWGRGGADVIPSGRSKASGINFIINKLGYEKEDTYAFGDSDNDVPMFEIAGTSIAMGQGTEEAKRTATYVTKPISEDGLAYGVKKYLLKK